MDEKRCGRKQALNVGRYSGIDFEGMKKNYINCQPVSRPRTEPAAFVMTQECQALCRGSHKRKEKRSWPVRRLFRRKLGTLQSGLLTDIPDVDSSNTACVPLVTVVITGFIFETV